MSAMAILTSVALPTYLKSVEQSRRSEAVYLLHCIRASELRYETEHKTFTTSWADLDIDDPNPQSSAFVYTIPSASAADFPSAATRTGGAMSYGLQIDRSGAPTEA